MNPAKLDALQAKGRRLRLARNVATSKVERARLTPIIEANEAEITKERNR